MSDMFYIIVPYFNFAKNKTGIDNLDLFIKNNAKNQSVRIVLVEGYYNNNQLPDYSSVLYKHIKLPVNHVLWVKENLINIGFKSLPFDWNYAGWIDRDVFFCNPHWVQQSIEKLKQYDIIQPWKEFLYLDKSYNYNTEDKIQSPSPHSTGYSFGYIRNSFLEGNIAIESTWKLFGHPGHAWGINREFYEKIGGLYEYCIIGGGDGVLSNCIKQDKIEDLLQWYWTMNFRFGQDIINFHTKFAGVKIGYTDGLLLHYYHGSIEKRNYNNRYKILEDNNFNPTNDLKRDNNGVLCFTKDNTVLEKDLTNYFLDRKEDE